MKNLQGLHYSHTVALVFRLFGVHCFVFAIKSTPNSMEIEIHNRYKYYRKCVCDIRSVVVVVVVIGSYDVTTIKFCYA